MLSARIAQEYKGVNMGRAPSTLLFPSYSFISDKVIYTHVELFLVGVTTHCNPPHPPHPLREQVGFYYLLAVPVVSGGGRRKDGAMDG